MYLSMSIFFCFGPYFYRFSNWFVEEKKDTLALKDLISKYFLMFKYLCFLVFIFYPSSFLSLVLSALIASMARQPFVEKRIVASAYFLACILFMYL